MICPEAMTCKVGHDGCFHANFHEQKADCLIEFDKCPKCIYGNIEDLEVFLTEEEMTL